MSQTSIFEKRWLDLVFEGKNKAYGAYQLRLENPRTTMLAMLYALLLISGATGSGLLLSSFGNKPSGNFLPPIESDTIVVTPYHTEPKADPIVPKPKTDTPPSTSEPVDDWRKDPVIAPPDDTNTNPTENPPATPSSNPGTGSENTGTPDNGSAGGTTTGSELPVDNGPVGTAVLDRQPMFPGGMQAFYLYVGNNFDKPNVDDSAAIRIFVSFVIEKDGTMTDIVVKNKPGAAFEREAIRVLKSLKKKWTPGVKNGQPMRVLYTLPITIKPE